MEWNFRYSMQLLFYILQDWFVIQATFKVTKIVKFANILGSNHFEYINTVQNQIWLYVVHVYKKALNIKNIFIFYLTFKP